MISVTSIQQPSLSTDQTLSTQPAQTVSTGTVDAAGSQSNQDVSYPSPYLPPPTPEGFRSITSPNTARDIGGSIPVTSNPTTGGALYGATLTTEAATTADVTAPTGATSTVSDTATMTTTEPNALQQVLANLGSLFGSSASGGGGAASPGAVTAVPVEPSTGTGSMSKLLIAAIVIGVAWYGYKKGWFRKLGAGGGSAA
jgi:hypothetical protein